MGRLECLVKRVINVRNNCSFLLFWIVFVFLGSIFMFVTSLLYALIFWGNFSRIFHSLLLVLLQAFNPSFPNQLCQCCEKTGVFRQNVFKSFPITCQETKWLVLLTYYLACIFNLKISPYRRIRYRRMYEIVWTVCELFCVFASDTTKGCCQIICSASRFGVRIHRVLIISNGVHYTARPCSERSGCAACRVTWFSLQWAWPADKESYLFTQWGKLCPCFDQWVSFIGSLILSFVYFKSDNWSSILVELWWYCVILLLQWNINTNYFINKLF